MTNRYLTGCDLTGRKLSIGFYAPMKAASHAVVSGDRRMARGFTEALERADFSVFSVSDVRCYLGSEGDAALAEVRAVMDEEFVRLRDLWEADAGLRPDLLFVYHLYHKSPDLLLHRLASHFGLPYVVAEASYAAKRRGGCYDEALELSAKALCRADLVVQLNAGDMGGVEDLWRASGVCSRQILLSPFMDVEAWRRGAEAVSLPEGWEGACIFMTHAMMRYGDKFRSYEVLAQALRVLRGFDNWRLVIIGGGEAEVDVRRLFADFGDRVYFVGLADSGDIAGWLGLADIYVWPAVCEAYGLGLLEAVVMGLPVIAGDRPGVRGIVADGLGGILCSEGDIAAFGDGLLRLYGDYCDGGELLRDFGDYNWDCAMGHDISVAVFSLVQFFSSVQSS